MLSEGNRVRLPEPAPLSESRKSADAWRRTPKRVKAGFIGRLGVWGLGSAGHGSHTYRSYLYLVFNRPYRQCMTARVLCGFGP